MIGSRRWDYKLALPVVMIFSPTAGRTMPGISNIITSLYIIYHVDVM
jgi:hypothetical protein